MEDIGLLNDENYHHEVKCPKNTCIQCPPNLTKLVVAINCLSHPPFLNVYMEKLEELVVLPPSKRRFFPKDEVQMVNLTLYPNLQSFKNCITQ